MNICSIYYMADPDKNSTSWKQTPSKLKTLTFMTVFKLNIIPLISTCNNPPAPSPGTTMVNTVCSCRFLVAFMWNSVSRTWNIILYIYWLWQWTFRNYLLQTLPIWCLFTPMSVRLFNNKQFRRFREHVNHHVCCIFLLFMKGRPQL